MKSIRAMIFILLTISFAKSLGQQVTVYRQSRADECITGYLYVDETPICYTLELPWRDNLNDLSCIPDGTYSANIRFDKKDQWRIQLLDVPDRGGVQIHIGNWPSEIQGCILVGTSVNINDCSLSGSA